MRNIFILLCSGSVVWAQISFQGSGSSSGFSGSSVIYTGSTGRVSPGTSGGSQSNSWFEGSDSSRFTSSSSCCKPASQCASSLISSSDRLRSSCKLFDGSFGLCCSSGGSSSGSKYPFTPADQSNFSIRSASFSSSQVSTAVRRGLSFVDNATLFSNNFASPARSTGAFYHARFQRQARSETGLQGKSGLILEQVARELSINTITVRQAGGSADAVNFGPNVQARQNLGSGTCPRFSSCSSSRYRSADGSCNNERDGNLGKADTVLSRILPPQYFNGVDSPRRSISGGELPSPRLVSTSLAKDVDTTDSRYSVVLMNFGQFIDHDLTHVPVMKAGDGRDLDCCSNIAGSEFSSFCSPISIPSNDPFFRGQKSCMNFVRSSPGPALDCSLRYREQVNQLTHWLDLSQVYGSSLTEQREVRAFTGGRLLINAGPDGPLLPVDTQETSCKAGACMKAGDGRVNEQPNLGVMHTMFLREHNRIAGELSALNPGWSDEQVFQETRKILIGVYQHIVYNEWLPIILGKQFMGLFGLFPQSQGYSGDYDPSIDPRITNEFAAAALRFGHSLIPSFIRTNNRIGREVNPAFSLRDSFFKPELLRLPGMIDGLVSGLTKESIQQFDSSFTSDITNNLFDGDANGMDLVALNIQRGRDHGLPGYTRYRELCGLGSTNSFSDLSRQMPFSRTEELRNVYDSPQDIDLFIGNYLKINLDLSLNLFV